MRPRTCVLHFGRIMVTDHARQSGFLEDGWSRGSLAPLLLAMMTSALDFTVHSAECLVVRSVNFRSIARRPHDGYPLG